MYVQGSLPCEIWCQVMGRSTLKCRFKPLKCWKRGSFLHLKEPLKMREQGMFMSPWTSIMAINGFSPLNPLKYWKRRGFPYSRSLKWWKKGNFPPQLKPITRYCQGCPLHLNSKIMENRDSLSSDIPKSMEDTGFPSTSTQNHRWRGFLLNLKRQLWKRKFFPSL